MAGHKSISTLNYLLGGSLLMPVFIYYYIYFKYGYWMWMWGNGELPKDRDSYYFEKNENKRVATLKWVVFEKQDSKI
jgi:hypothetical protein